MSPRQPGRAASETARFAWTDVRKAKPTLDYVCRLRPRAWLRSLMGMKLCRLGNDVATNAQTLAAAPHLFVDPAALLTLQATLLPPHDM
jgi:hypothetical protein